jgi:hypothetical protein
LVYRLVCLLLGQGGDELAAEVGDVGDDAAPDKLGASANDDNLRDTLDVYGHAIAGLGEDAATAMEDTLGDDLDVGSVGGVCNAAC